MVEGKLCTVGPKKCTDETHFLIEFPEYQQLRTVFIRLSYIESPLDNLQFIQLMKSKSEYLIYNLAKCLKEALNLRNENSP